MALFQGQHLMVLLLGLLTLRCGLPWLAMVVSEVASVVSVPFGFRAAPHRNMCFFPFVPCLEYVVQGLGSVAGYKNALRSVPSFLGRIPVSGCLSLSPPRPLCSAG